MRVAVLVLVLANFAVFAWLKWAPPQGGARDSRLVPAPAAGTRLVLLPRPASSGTAASPPACLRFGPIASTTAAVALATHLQAAGYSVQASERQAQVPEAWQVLLTGYRDDAAARREVAKLRRKGVRNFFVREAPGANGASISLGLFRDREHARRLAVRIRALGFHPRIVEHLRSETRHYLEVSALAGAAAAIRAAAGTAPLTHGACSAPATAVSAPAPASR